MENNKKTKSDKKTLLVVLLLLVAIVAVILATYAWAKYVKEVDGEATAQVAKWNIKGETGGAFTHTFTNIVEEKIAPGTGGNFTASLDVEGTEVDVDYIVTLVSVQPLAQDENGDIIKNDDGSAVVLEGDDAKESIPHNLVIKKGDNVIYKNRDFVDGNNVIASGTIKVVSGNESSMSETFSWEWPYETGEDNDEKAANNILDTADGEKAGAFKVTYRIDAVQAVPEEDTP